MPGLKAGFGSLRVYSRSDRHIDRGAMAGQTYNRTVTLVMAIALGGALAPPLLIHKRATLSKDTIAAPISLPETLVTDTKLQHFASCANETGWITRRLFLAFCRRLRAFTGHTEPLLLISDGHRTRISAEVVAYLRSINIFLFLIPPYTSHCLSPSDQWHQHVSRDRIRKLVGMTSIAAGRAATAAEECCALYHAIHEQSSHPDRIIAAWKAAGITRTRWGWDLMSNKPPPETVDEIHRAPSPPPITPQTLPPSASPPDSLDPTSTPRTLLRWAQRAHDYIQAAQPDLKRLDKLEHEIIDIAAHQQRFIDKLSQAAAGSQSKRAKVEGIHGLLVRDEPLQRLRQVSDRAAGQVDKAQRRATLCASLEQIQQVLNLPGTSKSNLQAACRAEGISVTGNKPDLLRRLQYKLGLPAFPTAAKTDAPAPSAPPTTPAMQESTAASAQAALDSGARLETVDICHTEASNAPTANTTCPAQTLDGSEAACGDVNASLDRAQDDSKPGYGKFPSFDFWIRDLPDRGLSTIQEPSSETSRVYTPFSESELDCTELEHILQACDPATRLYRDTVLPTPGQTGCQPVRN
ncbi:uncharacterized protein MONBRDRAFT_28611 [Monosiga brevicollis MX1]|uniref:SAP domain-containing protein n=1 Tax=Monosiga brevicollis TaxID=81824 RepID=A9V8N8_MONBE|nr:uncharacterized protein MONBRDRAFT_28611 [Monosiga brevicollis MX1]EDQ86118.1 predicted protein [Monosiga brevicollis MX1]|eukprot:XP_001749043.1 hypothetical protein [Monosiga brevicollis MX1]